jgi:hypothetical protein
VSDLVIVDRVAHPWINPFCNNSPVYAQHTTGLVDALEWNMRIDITASKEHRSPEGAAPSSRLRLSIEGIFTMSIVPRAASRRKSNRSCKIKHRGKTASNPAEPTHLLQDSRRCSPASRM